MNKVIKSVSGNLFIVMLPFIVSALSLTIANTFQSKPQEEPWIAPKWADTLTNSKLKDPKFIGAGMHLYHNNCIGCHGEKGRGDGTGGIDLTIPPGDLTDKHTISESDGAIYWKITNGRRPMLEYHTKFEDEERWQLVAYVRELQRNRVKALTKKLKTP